MRDDVAIPDGSELSEGLPNPSQAVDWERHRYGDGVQCEFRPRAEYDGRTIKPGLAEKAGLRLVLFTMWLMDKDDPYPDEYALSTADTCDGLLKQLGVAWVASGDVAVLPNAKISGRAA